MTELETVWHGALWRECDPPAPTTTASVRRVVRHRDIVRAKLQQQKWTANELAVVMGMLPTSVHRIIKDLHQVEPVREEILKMPRRPGQRGRYKKQYWIES